MILGTGIDIVEIERKAVERWGDSFLKHILTPEEMKLACQFKSPYQFYAGRFAAKEAIFKAAGIPHLSWHDVSIINDADGKPVCHDHNKKLKNHLFISISHSRDYAVASAIVEG